MGWPTPNRSHFKAADQWASGLASGEGPGWLTRAVPQGPLLTLQLAPAQLRQRALPRLDPALALCPGDLVITGLLCLLQLVCVHSQLTLQLSLLPHSVALFKDREAALDRQRVNSENALQDATSPNAHQLHPHRAAGHPGGALAGLARGARGGRRHGRLDPAGAGLCGGGAAVAGAAAQCAGEHQGGGGSAAAASARHWAGGGVGSAGVWRDQARGAGIGGL